MFGTDFAVSIDELEQQLLACESKESRLRQRQAALLNDLDGRQVYRVDGCRSFGEWVRYRLDVSEGTAKDFVDVARRLPEQPQLGSGPHKICCRLSGSLRLAVWWLLGLMIRWWSCRLGLTWAGCAGCGIGSGG
jgi:hypothetical protein